MKFRLKNPNSSLSQLKFFFRKEKFFSQDFIRIYITTAVFAVVFFVFQFDILKRFELVTYDYRHILRGPRPVDPAIAVIEISDDSVAKIGRWPWDRDWHATLIKILSERGAKAVVFDVIFSEPSDPQKDEILAQSIGQSKIVYLAEVLDQGTVPPTLLTSLPAFSGKAGGMGHINLEPDVDGVMRRVPLFLEMGGKKIPQLALSVFLSLYGAKPEDMFVRHGELKILFSEGKTLAVPLDHQGRFVINWAGRWKDTFKHYSYIDVITSYVATQNGAEPAIPADAFKDKVCFVGTSAAGLFDIRPTPLEPAYPAVGVHLNVYQNLIDQKFIHAFGKGQNLLVLLVLLLVLLNVIRIESHFKSVLWALGLMAGFIVTAIGSFVLLDLWINMVYPLVFIFLAYFFVTVYNQLSVTIEKAKLFKLATRDSLSGLFNIGHFKLLLKAEIMTIQLRREKKLSIIMSDVDNFKSTNDTYGHVTGDAVLREVAKAFQANSRALDVPARYGGEEFILMLPGANEEEAAKVANKIREAIAAKIFFHEKGDFNKTISFGVTRVSPDDSDIESLVARADRALYEAKHSGKNKVVIAKDSPRFDDKGDPLPFKEADPQPPAQTAPAQEHASETPRTSPSTTIHDPSFFKTE